MALELLKITGSQPYYLNNANTAEELVYALEDYMRTGTQIIFQHDGDDCILTSYEYNTDENKVIAYFVTPKKKLLKVDIGAGWDLVITESELGGGGVSSWDDLIDKPFSEETFDPIEWDGNPEGRVTMPLTNNYQNVLIDDRFLEQDELVDSTITIIDDTSGKRDILVEKHMLLSFSEEGHTVVYFENNFIVESVNEQYVQSTTEYPQAGTYVLFFKGGTYYVSKISFPSKIKQIDSKFIPKEPERVISWNDLTDKPFGETLVDLDVFVDMPMGPAPNGGGALRQTMRHKAVEGEMFAVTVGDVVYIAEAKTVDGVLTLVWDGESFSSLRIDATTHTLLGFVPPLYEETNVKMAWVEYRTYPLDEKYIPDTIARTEDVAEQISTAIGNAIGGSY